MKSFDLAPTPEVLVALTHAPLKPIDALCELVDNAIDSFSPTSGDLDGINEISIDLPTPHELSRGEGVIRITDNGPGMTAEEAKKALMAGYSSQKAYGQLGMFGVGLNIAAGKFARTTRLVTATKTSSVAVVVDVNLDKLIEQRNFQVQPLEEPKDKYFKESENGTIIELSEWWPQGSQNSDNPMRLIRSGPGQIRAKLERRYATLLRTDSKTPFRIIVKGVECSPFEHCVWGEHRSVKRGSSNYHAMQRIDELLRSESRCTECGGLASNGVCPLDSSHPVESIEEHIRGWVGVQRYDDISHFGIDLIRHGRAIRVLEKDAFFTFENESGEIIKDYPIDGIYGRIVGEIHLDHVRVDFTKQDFVRSTPEWQRAIQCLRGESALQTNKPGASENKSPIMNIFRGYRRVRKIGLGDMYMGERRAGDNQPKRISRDVERDFLKRFRQKEEGYYDDAKWWEKVEEASQPVKDFEECPECEFQNPTTTETCEDCGHLLKSKHCVECKVKIPQSAPKCEHCGQSQIPEGPWECGSCGANQNSPDVEECRRCGKPKGSIDAFSLDILLDNSLKNDNLSIDNVEIELINGEKSTKFNLETRIARLHDGNVHLPMIVDRRIPEREIQIFIDINHPLFSSLQIKPEHVISAEVAAFIASESNPSLSKAQTRQQNLTVLQGKFLEKYWKHDLADDSEQVQRDMLTLLDDIRSRLVDNMLDITDEVFNSMSTSEINEMVENMKEADVDVSEMGKLKDKGKFLLYVSPKTVVSIFRLYPEKFFDSKVWDSHWDIPGLPDENVKKAQQETKETYLNCLEDSVSFLRYGNPSRIVTRRTRLSIEFLQNNISD